MNKYFNRKMALEKYSEFSTLELLRIVHILNEDYQDEVVEICKDLLNARSDIEENIPKIKEDVIRITQLKFSQFSSNIIFRKMSRTEFEQKVSEGYILIVYRFCISFGISVSHPSRIFFLKGYDRYYRGVPYSLISLFAGLWGFPGIIMAFADVVHNCAGGNDMTKFVSDAIEMDAKFNEGKLYNELFQSSDKNENKKII